MRSVLVAVGTRPEGIKMAPVIHGLAAHPDLRVEVLHSGQHTDLLDETLRAFHITVDHRLEIDRGDGSLAALSAGALSQIAGVLERVRPFLVLAQGDTTTVLVTALAAFYTRIPFGHVEAGLRTGDLSLPYPEEMNRRLTADLAALHFAPTQAAVKHLLAEGIPAGSITRTGNTVIDALYWMLDNGPMPPAEVSALVEDPRPLLLVTAHRRESWGAPMDAIAGALTDLAEQRPDLQIVFPVHPNPIVRRSFGSALPEGVRLLEPLAYDAFVPLLARATVLLTDSGGIQEEAAALGKPVLVMRTVTERGEGVQAGSARLVGTDRETIVRSVIDMLETAPGGPAVRSSNPYGDGLAAARIVEVVANANL